MSTEHNLKVSGLMAYVGLNGMVSSSACYKIVHGDDAPLKSVLSRQTTEDRLRKLLIETIQTFNKH